jgi:hypothetical protein
VNDVRFRHPDGTIVHLAYSANVHPAEDLGGTLERLRSVAGPVRRALGTERLGVGLWLPAPAAARLASDGDAVTVLRRELDRLGLEVVTLNGFPYRGFSEPVVKHAVYRPDWTEPERARYTLDLARVLVRLLPEDVTVGTISTLPLAWREPWDADRRRAAEDALTAVAGGLARLADEAGRVVRLALEPEPGCVLETAVQAADGLAGVAGEWIGACLDACHLAVGFEDPREALGTLTRSGVGVAKAQVSAAVRAADPATPAEAARLAGFAEPRFLHQTRERRDGTVLGVDDLDEALAGGLPGVGEWRVHFHAPVHAGEGTTQPELIEFLAALVGGAKPATRHLELETYTWSVLPAAQRPADDAGLVDGLVHELTWVAEQLAALGLEAV